MSGYIASALSELSIVVSQKTIMEVANLVIRFEMRGTHPLAFNGQTLGVHPIRFDVPADRDALFNIFGITEFELVNILKKIPSIDMSRKVTSDAFNIFCVWLVHMSYVYIREKDVREQFQLSVMKYLHYRYFTSLVNHFFPHNADSHVMAATINNLTNRYDIIKNGTWKVTIEERCRDLLSPKSIHRDTFETGRDDKQFLYVISDTQSRMRDKVKEIASVYYDFHNNRINISSTSMVQEIDGEKILVSQRAVIDSVVMSIMSEVSSIREFIDEEYVRSITKQFSAVPTNLLRVTLSDFSTLSNVQVRTGKADLVTAVQDYDRNIYVGANILVRNIIQASIRYCTQQGIPISKKNDLYTSIRNIYSSSRIKDENINAVKDSVGYFLDNSNRTTRDATKASLRLAFIMYIILKSLKYL
jgi:hypothetical protein